MTALTALRNQFSVKLNEVVSPQDERLLLCQHWMELSPGAQDIFEAWEGSNQVCGHNVLAPQRSDQYRKIPEANVSLCPLCFGHMFSLGPAILALYVSVARTSNCSDTVIASMDAPITLQSRCLT